VTFNLNLSGQFLRAVRKSHAKKGIFGAVGGEDILRWNNIFKTLTLTALGLEEPRNSQELLIESVGPVFLFCVLCHIVPMGLTTVYTGV